jgi:hypothetical protein
MTVDRTGCLVPPSALSEVLWRKNFKGREENGNFCAPTMSA